MGTRKTRTYSNKMEFLVSVEPKLAKNSVAGTLAPSLILAVPLAMARAASSTTALRVSVANESVRIGKFQDCCRLDLA